MKKIVCLIVLILGISAIAQIQFPQNQIYVPSKLFDSPIYKNPPANFLEEYDQVKLWPQINHTSYDEKKNFNLTSGSGLIFTPLNNGLQIDLNLLDINAKIIDGNYIRTDGTSITTAEIPFFHGIQIANGNNIDFGNADTNITFRAESPAPYSPERLTINMERAKSTLNLFTQNDGSIHLDAGDYISLNATNSILITSPQITTGPLTADSGVSNSDFNANRFCFPDGTCMNYYDVMPVGTVLTGAWVNDCITTLGTNYRDENGQTISRTDYNSLMQKIIFYQSGHWDAATISNLTDTSQMFAGEYLQFSDGNSTQIITVDSPTQVTAVNFFPGHASGDYDFRFFPYGGGDHSTTFTLPDSRGRATLNTGQSITPTSTYHAIGQNAGEETHTLSIDEIPSHSHNLPTNIAQSNLSTSKGSSGSTVVSSITYNSTYRSQGGGQAHNTMMPYLTERKCIKISD